MAKKRQEEQVEAPVLFPKEDRMTIEALKKVTHPTKDQMDTIYELYKKYINPVQPMYRTNCNCAGNIVGLYWRLLEWFDANTAKFEY